MKVRTPCPQKWLFYLAFYCTNSFNLAGLVTCDRLAEILNLADWWDWCDHVQISADWQPKCLLIGVKYVIRNVKQLSVLEVFRIVYISKAPQARENISFFGIFVFLFEFGTLVCDCGHLWTFSSSAGPVTCDHQIEWIGTVPYVTYPESCKGFLGTRYALYWECYRVLHSITNNVCSII